MKHSSFTASITPCTTLRRLRFPRATSTSSRIACTRLRPEVWVDVLHKPHYSRLVMRSRECWGQFLCLRRTKYGRTYPVEMNLSLQFISPSFQRLRKPNKRNCWKIGNDYSKSATGC